MKAKQVSLEEAIALCQQDVRPVATTQVKLEQAVGRICAAQYCAPECIPAFDRSRVDGYALHQRDVSSSDSQNLNLVMVGSIKAGEHTQAVVNPGETWRIMTGAILPAGCGAVIKQEEVDRDSRSVTINKKVYPGDHIEKKGSTITRGSVLASPGQRLKAVDLEKLASAGVLGIQVYQRPGVYLIQTGDELVMPGNNLPTGKIYNSNRSQFFALILSRGARPLAGDGPTGDCIEDLADEITKGVQKAPLVIITGGTQQGDFDVVRAAMHKLKAHQLFAGIDIRPGHTTSAWLLDQSLIFNLPGNPKGGYLLFHALIRPVLNLMSGLNPADEKWLLLPLNQTHIKRQAHRCLNRGVLTFTPDGQCQLVPPEVGLEQPGWEVIADIPGLADQEDYFRSLVVGDELTLISH